MDVERVSIEQTAPGSESRRACWLVGQAIGVACFPKGFVTGGSPMQDPRPARIAKVYRLPGAKSKDFLHTSRIAHGAAGCSGTSLIDTRPPMQTSMS